MTNHLTPCVDCPHDYGDHGDPRLTDQSCSECDCPRFRESDETWVARIARAEQEHN